MSTLHFARGIPLKYEADVFVAGGGPAGIAAAVAAARTGCKVFLAEAQGCLGGMGTAGLVPAFMSFSDGVNFLAGGVGREVYDRCFRYGVQGPEDRYDPSHAALAIRPEALKRLYDDLLTESGVEFTFFTQVVAVEFNAGRVDFVVCASKSGLFAARAAAYVDCTGDGDLAAWAGAPFEKGGESGEMMPATLCSIWTDIDWDAVRRSGLWPQAELPRAFGKGVFTVEDRHLPGIWRTGLSTGGGNVGHEFGVDGTDERSLTKAVIVARKRLLEYQRFYREYLKGYERMELVATGALLGVRETRRILGDYMLTLDDFIRRASFPDEIGRFNYPVDMHAARPDKSSFDAFEKDYKKFRYGPGESYGIPYRILTPKGLDNLWVAGRCVSADRRMQSSIRVMPGCFITGQAAGAAAALSVKTGRNSRTLDIAALQGQLKALGVYLPSLSQ